MEFNKKLQLLRKQHNITQEQLAEKLFVSRTAISKWESGKGYPSIDSLKSISKLFSISIDELLSTDELINFAKSENKHIIGKMVNIIYGILDFIILFLLFIPLFSQKLNNYYYTVSLLNFSDSSTFIISISYIFVILLSIVGLIELIIQNNDFENFWNKINFLSLLFSSISIIFFISIRQLYVATILFIFLMLKVVLLIKKLKIK